MASYAPRLSAIAGSLDDLTRRVTSLAEEVAGAQDDDASSELFEIERLLQHATRRLERLLR